MTRRSRASWPYGIRRSPRKPERRAPARLRLKASSTREAAIEAALAGGTSLRSADTDGHGTHVAGTAAGNGASLSPAQHVGMAPEAEIIAVKAGNGSYATANIIDGITYCDEKAAAEGKPVVVNMSLGSQFGAHDGKDAKSVAVNDFGKKAGRVAVQSAGNDGGDDIHVTGSLPDFSTVTYTFTVPAYTPASGAENDEFAFDLWFDGSSGITAELTRPSGAKVTQAAGGQGTSNTSEGSIYLFNYNDPSNGQRHLYMTVSDASTAQTPASGTWTLRVTSNGNEEMTYHGWVVRSSFGTNSDPVGLAGADARYTLSNTAAGGLAVGSYVHRWNWCAASGSCYLYSNAFDGTTGISDFSSSGPTRDGRALPHLAAPGQATISTLSQDYALDPAGSRAAPGGKHYLTQGTSMASPAVAGSVALLMEQDPTLNFARTLALLQSEADVDAFTGAVPNDRWGAGKLDVFGAMARLVNTSSSANRTVLAYDDFAATGAVEVTSRNKVAVRFTPPGNAGEHVTGALFHASSTLGLAQPLSFEVWTDGGGAPGTQVGNTVAFPASLANAFGWSYADLSAADAVLSPGQEYFLVLYFTEAEGKFSLMHDASTPTGRSLANVDGGAWFALGYDLRIRPVVASNIVLTDVADAALPTDALVLAPSLPNPFTDRAEIRFAVPVSGAATVEVFNVLGQKVAVLFDEPAAAGQTYRVQFGSDGFASGLYVYRLTHGGKTVSRSMTLVR